MIDMIWENASIRTCDKARRRYLADLTILGGEATHDPNRLLG